MIKPKLSRELGVALLLFYGLGNILGAGIYVLIGKVASIAGYMSVASFLLSSIIAGFTAFSYIELASRYPVSAGEAVYVQEGFGKKYLSISIGIFIAISGLVSVAALSHGFVGYLQEFININTYVALILVLAILVLISLAGIKQSIIAASVLTIIEIFGLLLIIFLGFDNIVNPTVEYTKFIPDIAASDISLIFLGSFLAFYAFIGFEDMVNVAEEVKSPTTTYPKAIILALIISTTLYFLIAVVAIQSLSLEQLSNSNAPFSDIYRQITGNDPILITVIGLFAVINGALIQLIMASRVVYGLAAKGWLPSALSEISKKNNIPVKATIVVGIIALIFTLFLDLITLASITSLMILIIFTLVNLSLILIKRKTPNIDGIYIVPVWVPWCGVILNTLLISVKLF
ncbi:MAG: amino acid permease [Campylobacteraceae bacterium]|jgi:amino acid transporter|nr:amino acid permease [Campylobacteraceae bacterium]MBT3882446.1 amino acid permease [Campylobacteraceae bacterium]MBT4030262.1 amino acid permease [Campylobacteraceae bacterium]MBT4178924.1 amino acid permease [Campylobacteraceae bacterium]MBT4572868.1 amino acid permease [Campylobacteraceae bacterium]